MIFVEIQCPNEIHAGSLESALRDVEPSAELFVLTGNRAQIFYKDEGDSSGFEAIVQAHDGADQNLQDYRNEAQGRIDAKASEVRGRFISGGIGQDTVYSHKEQEAQAYKDAGYPADTSAYPFIEAERQAWEGAKSARDCADLILGLAAQWLQVAATIEGVKVRGKNRVRAATDAQGIRDNEAETISTLDAIAP